MFKASVTSYINDFLFQLKSLMTSSKIEKHITNVLQ